MKKDLKEISTKTIEELRELLVTKREDLFKLRLNKAQNKLKNTRSIYTTRKEIARILTLIKEKELAPKDDSPANASSAASGEREVVTK